MIIRQLTGFTSADDAANAARTLPEHPVEHWWRDGVDVCVACGRHVERTDGSIWLAGAWRHAGPGRSASQLRTGGPSRAVAGATPFAEAQSRPALVVRRVTS